MVFTAPSLINNEKRKKKYRMFYVSCLHGKCSDLGMHFYKFVWLEMVFAPKLDGFYRRIVLSLSLVRTNV